MHSRQASVATTPAETVENEPVGNDEVLAPGVFIRQKMQMAD